MILKTKVTFPLSQGLKTWEGRFPSRTNGSSWVLTGERELGVRICLCSTSLCWGGGVGSVLGSVHCVGWGGDWEKTQARTHTLTHAHMHTYTPAVAMDPGVCSHWLAQQKIWLSCQTALRVGATKSKYIFQVQENTSRGEPREDERKYFFLIIFESRNWMSPINLADVAWPCSFSMPYAWSEPWEAHLQRTVVRELSVYNTRSAYAMTDQARLGREQKSLTWLSS